MSPKEMVSNDPLSQRSKSRKLSMNHLPVDATLDTASNLETNEALTSTVDMEPSDKEKARMARLRKQLESMKMSS